MMIRWYPAWRDVDIDAADMTWGEAAYAATLVLGALSLIVLLVSGCVLWLAALT